MVHVPVDTSVTALPDTVQTSGVVEEKMTVRPEVALAPSATGAGLIRTLPCVNVTVWVCGVTLKLCTASVAAVYCALPGWSAVMVHKPRLRRVIVFPATEQTLWVVDAKLIARFEVVVAMIGTEPALSAVLLSAANAIV